ncbi:MAG: hypothetical protein SOW01_05255 [Mediterranea sp.]|nr:hypothetical protein [Mediterranea sp.]
MNKQFSFRIKVRGTFGNYSFVAPCENGFVITNQYCPNELLVGEGNIFAQITIPQNGESEAEFIQDCNNIVAKANNTPDNDTFFCLGQAVNGVMIDHINRCGRLLFQDLLIYMDCFAHLLKATGYNDADIKRTYPIIVKQIVDAAKDLVKDSHTLRPIQNTNLYRILCKLVQNNA